MDAMYIEKTAQSPFVGPVLTLSKRCDKIKSICALNFCLQNVPAN